MKIGKKLQSVQPISYVDWLPNNLWNEKLCIELLFEV